MGMVAMTYKLNPDADVEDINTDAIAEYVRGLANDVYDVTICRKSHWPSV